MKGRRVRVDGETTLWVREWGETTNLTPLVCWHMLGAGQSGERLAGLASRLVDDYGLRVFALDGPGFGKSPALPADRYRPSLLADLVPRLLDALELQRVDFLGASWGGTIGCFVAERHRARLRRLVLLDVGYQAPLDRAPLETWISRAAERDDGVPAELRGAILWGVAREPPSATQLANVEIPVLLLTATEPRADDAAVAAFRSALPTADVREISGASHDLVRDAEPRVASVVGSWLRAT
jgi:pimeloyl-ACP methyl ester carboxylesterase